MISFFLPTVLASATAYVGSTSFLNSSQGIHAFLTFDSKSSPASIAAYAGRIDYVWGASERNVPLWRNSSNANIILSKYIPFTRDPAAHVTGHGANATGLPWWEQNRPELVLYQCDRTTPAWECFSGEGCRHTDVPLDLTNPATLEYQMQVGVLPAKAKGYNAIAFDNYGTSNQWKACGAFKGPGGAWVQIYNATDPAHDPQYGLDVLNWTARAVDAIHAAGMLVIPNWSAYGSEHATAIAGLVDGVLAEAGWCEWNPVPNTTSFTTPPPKTTPSRFAAQLAFVRSLQRQGKGYFAINEWGAGPDYGLNPSAIPHNITRDVRQFVVAAFMLSNGRSSGVFLSCIQCYGGGSGGLGNFSIWEPEYSADVGTPEGEPSQTPAGIWVRRYSRGLAAVNPAATEQAFVLPPLTDQQQGLVYRDLYHDTPLSGSVMLPPASGLVLVVTSK